MVGWCSSAYRMMFARISADVRPPVGWCSYAYRLALVRLSADPSPRIGWTLAPYRLSLPCVSAEGSPISADLSPLIGRPFSGYRLTHTHLSGKFCLQSGNCNEKCVKELATRPSWVVKNGGESYTKSIKENRIIFIVQKILTCVTNFPTHLSMCDGYMFEFYSNWSWMFLFAVFLGKMGCRKEESRWQSKIWSLLEPLITERCCRGSSIYQE